MPFAYLLHGEGIAVRWLASRPMRQLGLWSYSFYLAHMAVVALVLQLAPGLHGPALMLAAFPATLAWCWAMDRFVERPCARLRRRWIVECPREPILAEGARVTPGPEPIPRGPVVRSPRETPSASRAKRGLRWKRASSGSARCGRPSGPFAVGMVVHPCVGGRRCPQETISRAAGSASTTSR